MELAVVIPTFNELQNVDPMLERLRETLRGIAWEVVFVDDSSPDGAAAHIRKIARSDPRVRVLQCVGRRGLAPACIESMRATPSRKCDIAVMDADLQRDESMYES